MESGVFIAIEGIDGCGKTTQSKKLVKWLEKKQIKAVYTKEPTDGVIGRILKKMVRRENVDPRIEALLFAADRLEHLKNTVLPLLEKGYVVVSDRYVYSSLAYQSVTTGDPQWVREINKYAVKPDLAILLDVEPNIGLSRIKRRKTKFEKEKFLEEVREKYLEMVRNGELKVIDASKNVDEVAEELVRLVGSFLKTTVQ
ncbi:MAG: dTMP kinase [Nitrososphaerota archaeon]|nr:dTMP kinase [Candidatus Geocrenenecus dongiae]